VVISYWQELEEEQVCKTDTRLGRKTSPSPFIH